MKRNAVLLASAAGLGAGACFLSGLYRFVFVNPSDPIFEYFLRPRLHEEWYYRRRDGDAASVSTLPCREYTMTSVRGKRLKGFYYTCSDKPCGKIAFIVHGYRSNHAETAGIHFNYYMSRGFDVFCPDHEAAGQSEGHIIGYDWYESQDCLNWLKLLIGELGEDIQILLHGFSMGGGTVLMMSDALPKQVKFIVSDSGYTCAEGILHPGTGPLYAPLRRMNCVIGGYDLKDTDVRPHLAKAHIPILFVHGEQDGTVPFSMGTELYAGYEGEKDCLFVPDARHIEAMYVDPDGYSKKLDNFIGKFFA